jgi:hypothetical protein
MKCNSAGAERALVTVKVAIHSIQATRATTPQAALPQQHFCLTIEALPLHLSFAAPQPLQLIPFTSTQTKAVLVA